MAVSIEISTAFIEKVLNVLLPDALWTLNKFGKKADSDGLTPNLKNEVIRHKAEGWAVAYELFDDLLFPSALGLTASTEAIEQKTQVIFSPLIDAQESALPLDTKPLPLHGLIRTHLRKAQDISTNQASFVQTFADLMFDWMERALDDISDADTAFMDEDEPEVLFYDDDGNTITRQALFLSVALVIVFNHISCMVHRKTMFQLVAEAKAENDDSLLKAIQIDKSCETSIDYFQERIQRAQSNFKDKGERDFLDRIAQAVEKPIGHSRVYLRPFYFVLTMLDSLGLLDAYTSNIEAFAKLCANLDVYGERGESIDIESFKRTIRRFKEEYRSLAPNSILKDKITWIVKDTKI